MTKTKTPLFGLGAHGSVGNTLTFQDRNKQTMIRKKPKPSDPYTLLQAYHRWDYQDYAIYWHTLTPAQKSQWESDARRYKITGFNLWMRTYLNSLSDLAGRWHLDQRTGVLTLDSSKNNNDGIIYGATDCPGIIGNALSFDGNDDYINCGNNDTLRFTDNLSVLLWVHDLSSTYNGYVVIGRYYTNWELWICGSGWGDKLDILIGNTHYMANGTFTQHQQWVPIAFTFDDAADTLIQYVNGEQVFANYSATAQIPVSSEDLLIGRRRALGWGLMSGYLDQISIYNRTLSPAEVKRHAERRYP